MSQYYPYGIISVGSSQRERYPLVQSRCHYEILDVYTIANLVQDYYSQARTARDVEYVFPLPPSAAVCSFKAIIDESRIIKGIVKEKEEAKREFNEAVAQGKTAGLLQQEHADVFRVSLGNIQPNQKISVHISYVSIVPHDGDSPQSLRITMPTAIAPRYGQAPPNIPWFSNNTKNRFELTVAIQMSKPVTAVTSPSHLIGLTLGCAEKELRGVFDPTRAFIYLGDAAFLDKDIVIVIAAQGLDVPRCSVERWLSSEGAEETTDAYALTLVPKFDLPALPSQEYIFLVDRSGSMAGGRMEKVKTGLQIMLRSLPSENTTFNIISFGSHYTSLWPKSQMYTAETVAEASRHVDRFTASYGGTEMRGAIRFALQSRLALTQTSSKDKTPASVFVLTDGEAWDLNGVVDVVTESVQLAKTQNSLLRTFVLGVGNQVSTAMCDGIARAGRGSAVFVATGEKPDAKLMSLLKAARGAVIEDLTVDWGVSELEREPEGDFEMVSGPSEAGPVPQSGLPPINLFDEQTPSTDSTEVGPKRAIVYLPPPPVIQQAPNSDKLPIPLYPGFRCSIFAIVKQSSNPGPPSNTVKITGKVMGRAVSFQTPVIARSVGSDVTSSAIESSKLLHTLAAKALIQVHEDVPSTPTIKAHIERLGKRYSLASSVTSFLAIDEELHDVMEPASRRRPRSRSPTRIVMREGSQSRSSSRERRRLIRPRSRSRSRSPSPVILGGRSYRHRSHSPQQVIVAGPSERPHSSQPIIIDGDGRRSRGLMSRVFGGSRRSPTRVITTASRRSRSRSHSPRRVLGRRRSRTPPIIIDADRSRSHSPSRRYGSRRDRSPPPVIITGSRSRSMSPRRRRSYSPRERHEGSQYDPVEYDRGTRQHRGDSYSPRRSRSPTRRGGSLFGGLFGRGTTHGGSRLDPVDYDRDRRRHSPRGGSPREGSRYDPEEYDRGTRRPREDSSRRLRQRPGHSLQEPEELDTGPPRSGRRLTGLTLSPPRTRLTHRPPSRSVSPEGTRPAPTHHSGRQCPPTTVLLREDEEYHSPTIHVDLDSERQGPAIGRVVHNRSRSHSPMRVILQGPASFPNSPPAIVTSVAGASSSYGSLQLPRDAGPPRPQTIRVSSPRVASAGFLRSQSNASHEYARRSGSTYPNQYMESYISTQDEDPTISGGQEDYGSRQVIAPAPMYDMYDPTIEDALDHVQVEYRRTRHYRRPSLQNSPQDREVSRGGAAPSLLSQMLSFAKKKKRDSTSSLPDAGSRQNNAPTPVHDMDDPTIEDGIRPVQQDEYGTPRARLYRRSSSQKLSQDMDAEHVNTHIGFVAGGGDSPPRFSRMLSFVKRKKRGGTSSLPDAQGSSPISPSSSSYTNYNVPPPASRRPGSSGMSPIIPRSIKMAPLTLETIVRSQHFNGSFPNDQAFLAQICGNKPVPGIPAALRDLTGDGKEETAKMGIWATVLTVACLKRKFALEKDSWEIFVEKAMVFIKNALDGNGALVDTLIADAEGLF